MKSNILYAKKTITLAQSTRSKNEVVTLPNGVCYGIYIVPVKDPSPNITVDVGIQNSQNGDIVTATDFRDYFHKGGGYLSGMKPLNYPTENQQFNINVNCQENVSEEIIFQVIFVVGIGKSEGTTPTLGATSCGCEH